MFEKTFALIALKQTAPGGSPVKLLLSGAVSVVLLAFITSLLMAGALAGGLYFLYHALMTHGVEASIVILLIYLFFFAILLILIRMAQSCLRRITDMGEEEEGLQSPVLRQITRLLNGLSNGF